jgi:hypothetical protein
VSLRQKIKRKLGKNDPQIAVVPAVLPVLPVPPAPVVAISMSVVDDSIDRDSGDEEDFDPPVIIDTWLPACKLHCCLYITLYCTIVTPAQQADIANLFVHMARIPNSPRYQANPPVLPVPGL